MPHDRRQPREQPQHQAHADADDHAGDREVHAVQLSLLLVGERRVDRRDQRRSLRPARR